MKSKYNTLKINVMKNKGKRKYIAQYVDGNIGIFAILRLTEQSLLDRK